MKKSMFVKIMLLMFLSLSISCGKPTPNLFLDGQWETSCMIDTEPGIYETKFNIKINSNKMEITQVLFGSENNNCSQPSDILKRFHTFREDKTTLHIEHTYFSSLLFYDQDFITVFNNINLCGFNDWTQGIEKETTNQTCEEGFDYSQPYSINVSRKKNTLILKDSYGDVIVLNKISP